MILGFLSTFPLRGTSPYWRSVVLARRDFYPRSPCGERLCTALHQRQSRRYSYPRSPCGERRSHSPAQPHGCRISIHVPLAGNVSKGGGYMSLRAYISIHVPLAGNVFGFKSVITNLLISIHVPLAGNVLRLCRSPPIRADFYPRSPCGERPPGMELR